MKTSNQLKFPAAAPMPTHRAYEGPLPDTSGLVWFCVERKGEREARVGVKPSQLAARMKYYESTGHRVWREFVPKKKTRK